MLTQQITMYGASSTPGSTPSSSVVNINDVGQLAAELHVPHVNEPDAISARATVSDGHIECTCTYTAQGCCL